MFASLLALPLFQHDLRAVIGVHPFLRAGDILLGDTAFCSFAHFALLQARGVFPCMRLHQRRKNRASGVDRWKRPDTVPAWMDADQHGLLPAFIDVRIVRYAVVRKGYRTRHVSIATTLMDTVLWPNEKIAELYGFRWTIETCFDHLKTTMNMNVLRCKDVAGVEKELAVYLVVYNLVRLAMLKAAKGQGASPWRISFVDALRWLAARMIGLRGVALIPDASDMCGQCGGKFQCDRDAQGRFLLDCFSALQKRLPPVSILKRTYLNGHDFFDRLGLFSEIGTIFLPEGFGFPLLTAIKADLSPCRHRPH